MRTRQLHPATLGNPGHLLWAFLWTKTYATEKVCAGMCGDDGTSIHEDTFRDWAWHYVEKVSYLEFELIRLEDRKIDNHNRLFWLDIDGVDCDTTNQGSCPKAFYGHKHRTPALRYELSTSSNQDGLLCHIAGPFPAGDWPDISIFRHNLKQKLEAGERVNADDGYSGDDPSHVVATRGIRYLEDPCVRILRSRLRKRHETFNGRIKKYKILSDKFRHPLWQHSSCFRFCCVAVQLSLKLGTQTLFGVEAETRKVNSRTKEQIMPDIATSAREAIDPTPDDDDDDDDDEGYVDEDDDDVSVDDWNEFLLMN